MAHLFRRKRPRHSDSSGPRIPGKWPGLTLGAKVAAGAVERLKFAEALPESAAERVVVRRMRDDAAVQAVVEGGVRVVRG